MSTDKCSISHNLSAMPDKEISAAIDLMESELKHYEKLLDESIANNEILAKTKIILRKLKQVSQELNELKRLKAIK
jgi:cell shape-determining protein MreC